MEIKINSKFEKTLPPLSEDEFNKLEQNVIEFGIREPLSLWRGFLIDGHNRYNIATKHGIEFETVDYTQKFTDELDVVLWIVKNQGGRRNIDKKFILAELMKYEGEIAERAREKKLSTLKQNTTELAPVPKREEDTPIHTHEVLADLAGVSPRTVTSFQKIKRSLPEPEYQAWVENKDVSIKAKEQEVRKEEKKQERVAQIEETKEKIKQENLIITNKHDVVILDPPWAYGRDYDPDGSRVANPYPEMTQDEIMAKCGQFHKDNSIMYLWTTHAFLFDAKALLDAWGFEYKACMVWDKEKIGMGHWLRMQCEFCLVGIKGKPLWDNTTYRDIIREPRREHSRKPEFFYDMVRELHDGMSIFEYFSREKREGIINAGVELE